MRRIGNDIVDLNAPENRKKSLDRRFLDRVFTPEEHECLALADNPDAMVWILWAGKEGAYKAISKDHPLVPSVPRLYRVRFASPTGDGPSAGRGAMVLPGIVSTPEGEVDFQTSWTTSYAHCVALYGASAGDAPTIAEILHLEGVEDLSVAVRGAARLRIASSLGVDPDTVEIQRQKTDRGYGPPHVVVSGFPSNIDISLSHDGDYGAFALSCG